MTETHSDIQERLTAVEHLRLELDKIGREPTEDKPIGEQTIHQNMTGPPTSLYARYHNLPIDYTAELEKDAGRPTRYLNLHTDPSKPVEVLGFTTSGEQTKRLQVDIRKQVRILDRYITLDPASIQPHGDVWVSLRPTEGGINEHFQVCRNGADDESTVLPPDHTNLARLVIEQLEAR